MKKALPRLLLVTEIPLSKEGTGVNRTLVNLLSSYPMAQFMLYKSNASNSDETSQKFSHNVAVFSEEFLPLIRNRFGKIVNKIIRQINLQIIDCLPIFHREKINAFAPEVILICPNNSAGLLVGHKIARTLNLPFLIYFMDDWINNNNDYWLTGNIQKSAFYLLNNASNWLMISHNLETELSKRYEIEPKKSFVVHNPVDLSDRKIPNFAPHTRNNFKIVYAGSIWQMHYDAIAAIAEAVYELRCDGVDIELVLHTASSFWNTYQTSWKKWEVTNGSLISYKELNHYLQEADLLLLPSSFLSENHHYACASLQTKITDYMASGRPILACGPSYSACNQFLKKWNCGLVCETNIVREVKKILVDTKQNIARSCYLAKNAYQVLQEQFESKRTIYNLYDLILQTKENSNKLSDTKKKL